ncbi:AAEL014049-PA [Aedes aegypti]|uniref:AAEL014049-PA n=1 Tax=Aedes aegypti TaxID=7159 RepID=Q16HF0_AEDAE|nr:AAEL014049-PA [Aedes aegypti]
MRMSINTPEDCTINEQFIKLVHETPILWNLHLPLYRNREIKDQKWAEVGAVFNLSGTEAYKKFVALREKYKREQKLRESKSIAQTECWRLYDKLKFLDTVSFSRDRRWSKPKVVIRRQNGFGVSTALTRQDLSTLLVKSEFPEMHMESIPTSPSYQMSGEPSENESSEAYQDNSDYYNDSTMQGAHSEEPDGPDYAEKIESMPDVHPVASTSSTSIQHHQQQFLNRLESKTNAILDDHDKRKSSWVRCETLGHRVAQTMHTLEEHDPDLALKFDIMLSEAITSIKKDQLQRLIARQEQQREDEEQRNRLETVRLQQQQIMQIQQRQQQNTDNGTT